MNEGGKKESGGDKEGSWLSLTAVEGPLTALPYPACPDKLCSTYSRTSSTFGVMQVNLTIILITCFIFCHAFPHNNCLPGKNKYVTAHFSWVWPLLTQFLDCMTVIARKTTLPVRVSRSLLPASQPRLTSYHAFSFCHFTRQVTWWSSNSNRGGSAAEHL